MRSSRARASALHLQKRNDCPKFVITQPRRKWRHVAAPAEDARDELRVIQALRDVRQIGSTDPANAAVAVAELAPFVMEQRCADAGGGGRGAREGRPGERLCREAR